MKARQNCPYCGKEALTTADKLLPGPASKVRCLHCARKVGVSWRVLIFILPVIALALLFQFNPQHSISVTALIGALCCINIYQIWFVQLEKR